MTIEQVKALESAQHHQNLWVQGATGTGKTIFAIETTYRALRAGLRVLIVYRSRQSNALFTQLLGRVNQKLSLLLHLDFMYLLRQQELHGIESEEFKHILCELLPDATTDNQYLFDLIIMDDCGTYEVQMPTLMQYVDELSSPEQNLPQDQITDIILQTLKPPERPSFYSYVQSKASLGGCFNQ